MSVTKIKIGELEDRSPYYQYLVEADEPGVIPEVVATGRASGVVQLADGTAYDVTDHFIEVASREHAEELHHHIGLQMERLGILDTTHPETGEQIPFRHTDCKHCDAPTSEKFEATWRPDHIVKARTAARKAAH